MESLQSTTSTNSSYKASITAYSASVNSARYQKDILVIEASFSSSSSSGDSSISDSFSDMSKGMMASAQKIVEKLNELLKDKLPDGISSLSSEDVTPDATADRIVSGVTAMYSAFAEQNPDLQGEELVKAFMEKVRSGVKQGYDDAFQTLQGLGALEFDGVQAGIEKTKQLIEEKLAAFEKFKLEEVANGASTESSVAELTKQELLQSGGAQTLNFTA